MTLCWEGSESGVLSMLTPSLGALQKQEEVPFPLAGFSLERQETEKRNTLEGIKLLL